MHWFDRLFTPKNVKHSEERGWADEVHWYTTGTGIPSPKLNGEMARRYRDGVRRFWPDADAWVIFDPGRFAMTFYIGREAVHFDRIDRGDEFACVDRAIAACRKTVKPDDYVLGLELSA